MGIKATGEYFTKLGLDETKRQRRTMEHVKDICENVVRNLLNAANSKHFFPGCVSVFLYTINKSDYIL